MVLLFLSFLSIPMESILQAARGYGLRLCGWVVLKLVILPVGLFYLTRAIYPEYALTALLLGGISSGVVSPFFSTLLKANTALVIVMVTASSILVPFTLPVLVRTLAGQTLVISLPAMVRLLAQVIFAPLVAAELVRFLSSRTAERISRNHYVLSLALCIAIILGVVSRYADFFYHQPSVILEAVLVSVVLAVFSFGAGALASLRSTTGRKALERYQLRTHQQHFGGRVQFGILRSPRTPGRHGLLRSVLRFDRLFEGLCRVATKTTRSASYLYIMRCLSGA